MHAGKECAILWPFEERQSDAGKTMYVLRRVIDLVYTSHVFRRQGGLGTMEARPSKRITSMRTLT